MIASRHCSRTPSASSADQTEIVLIANESALTRFANSAIHQNVYETQHRGPRPRRRRHGGPASAVSNSLEPDALAGAAETATAIARLQPENPDFPGLARPAPVEPVAALPRDHRGVPPERRARGVKTICDLAVEQGLVASGAFGTRCPSWPWRTRCGIFAYDAGTRAQLTTVVMSDDSSGYAERAAVDVAAIDAEARGARGGGQSGAQPQPGGRRARRVPRDPGALRGRGNGRLSRLHRPRRAGAAGGPQLHQRPPRASSWPRRAWTSGTTAATRAGCRWPSTSRACPSSASTSSSGGVARGVVYDRRHRRPRRPRVDRPRAPAPNTGRPAPTNLFLGAGDAGAGTCCAASSAGSG